MFLVSLAQAQTSYVPVTRLLKKEGYQLNLGADYFKTKSTADKNGTKTALPSGESFSRTQVELGGWYGAADNLQFGVGLRFRKNSSTFTNNGQEVTGTSSGIQSTLFSLMYSFKQQGQFQSALEGSFRYTPYTNKEHDSAENLVLGDDGNEIQAGLAGTYSFKNNSFLTARSGYRKPGKYISDEVYWQLEGAMAWKRIALVAGVDGVTSLHHDPYANSPSDRPAYNTGSSQLYNTSNREWITPYAGANFSIGQNWRVDLRAGQVVYGKSTDLGTTFGFQLVRRVEKQSEPVLDTQFKSYDLEATIKKISPQKGYAVIDKGMSDDVEKGMKFDFFEFDYVGGNVLIARGVVIQVKSSTAIVKITQRFNDKKDIKEGLVGRASLK